ncbi:MAG: hypothetical protein WBW73_26935 [Rhodoplanes sp.]
MGLSIGPWLKDFKDAILRGAADTAPIPAADQEATKPQTLPLGQLVSNIMKITKGQKIAYVVDVAYTRSNL